MSVDRNIAQARRAIARRLNIASSTVLHATVVEVDAGERTCVVEVDGVRYEDVRLYGVVDSALKGMVCLPKAQSTVLVSRIGGSNELCVVMFSEIDEVQLTIADKVELKITENEVRLNADKIVFNDGSNGGIVKVKELTNRINNIESQCNDILTALQGITCATGLAFAPLFLMPPLTSTTQNDIENDKIEH